MCQTLDATPPPPAAPASAGAPLLRRGNLGVSREPERALHLPEFAVVSDFAGPGPGAGGAPSSIFFRSSANASDDSAASRAGSILNASGGRTRASHFSQEICR